MTTGEIMIVGGEIILVPGEIRPLGRLKEIEKHGEKR